MTLLALYAAFFWCR